MDSCANLEWIRDRQLGERMLKLLDNLGRAFDAEPLSFEYRRRSENRTGVTNGGRRKATIAAPISGWTCSKRRAAIGGLRLASHRSPLLQLAATPATRRPAGLSPAFEAVG